MKMKYFIAFIAVLYAVSGEKEDFDNLEELMDNPDLLMELEKRLGALLSEDGPKSIQEKEAEVELFCNATTGTLSLGESSCDFHTSEEMIIRTTDSLEEGADFLGKIGNIPCAKDCTEHCCNDSRCDTAVYQDKDDHKCYLFRCGVPSVCVFDTHASFRVSSVSRAVHKSHSFVPGGNPVSHENELENLEPHVKKPEPGVTKAPTTTTESLLTTTTNPALGEACNFYGAKCADPHAECYMRECSCRAGFHQKHGVCRRHCREEEFECDNEGYGPDARQCVHSSYHCDGNRDCVDGSDERYCHKVDEDNHPGPMTSKQDTAYKPKEHLDTVDHVDKPTIVAESPMKELGASEEGDKDGPSVDKGIPSSTTTAVPSPKSPSGTITTPAPGNHKSSEAENHPPDVASKNVNSSDSDESEDRDEFAFFSSVNTEQVESYTDASQGPIVALALGLAITLILLIFVGCRLRNVKRRLRKGRALHSNEADYLINGMYL